jgi:hypothetical protein
VASSSADRGMAVWRSAQWSRGRTTGKIGFHAGKLSIERPLVPACSGVRFFALDYGDHAGTAKGFPRPETRKQGDGASRCTAHQQQARGYEAALELEAWAQLASCSMSD